MATREIKLVEAAARSIRTGEHVLAAVSGGADSTALLRVLAVLRDEGQIRLSAAHFEHGIRGGESLEDMRFVQEMCKDLSVPLFCGRGDVPAEAARRHMGIEEAAREMRRAFLQKARLEAGADVIALAHHADDQAETVLMRLFRGSAPAGMCGMRERQGIWLRPLLHCRKSRIIEYLSGLGQNWREDRTNFEECTPRNSLRLRVTPQIEQIWPGAVEAIVRYADIQAAESDFLDRTAREWLCQNAFVGPGGARIKTDSLPDGAVLARAMKILAGRSALQTDVDGLCALCRRGSGRFDMRSDEYAMAQGADGAIWLIKAAGAPEREPLNMAGETQFAHWGAMHACAGAGVPVRDDPFAQELDAEKCRGAELRLWKEGDRIRPLGMGGHSRLLSDVYAQRHISAPQRRMQVVLEKDGEILWAVGACIAEGAKLTPGCRAVRLKWEPARERPWENIMDKERGGTEE